MSRRFPARNDDGYLLLGLVVVCFLLLLALGVAAPRVARQLERDRELESEHRAQEYVRAIQLYYRRTNSFPTSIDQLLGNGTSDVSSAINVKYLRQKYKDPLTNDEFRLIHVGEAKTEVKGFFGDPLQGAPVGNLGSVANMQSNLGGTASATPGGSTPGLAGGSSTGFSLGGSSPATPSANSGAAIPAASGTTATTTGTTTGAAGPSTAGTATSAGTSASSSTPTGTGPSSSPSSIDATSFQGSKGAFVGVGSNAKGHGLVEWNGSENIEDWEFLYDPRVELLKAKVSLFGGSPAANGSGSLGSGFAPTSGATGNVGTAPAGFGGTSSGSGTPAGLTTPAGTTTPAGSTTPATGTSTPVTPQP